MMGSTDTSIKGSSLHTITVSVGSNLPDAHERVLAALQWLHSLLGQLRATDTYCTPARRGGSTYCNCVACGITALSAQELECRFKAYELEQGRNEAMRARHLVPIDIDVVVFDDVVLRPADYGRPYFSLGWQQLHQQNNESLKH